MDYVQGVMSIMSSITVNQTEMRDTIIEMRANKVWLDGQMHVLRKQYPNMYVAVRKQKVIGADQDFKKLMVSMKTIHGDIDAVLIEFVSAEDYYWIL